jgi:hypothetical protein
MGLQIALLPSNVKGKRSRCHRTSSGGAPTLRLQMPYGREGLEPSNGASKPLLERLVSVSHITPGLEQLAWIE